MRKGGRIGKGPAGQLAASQDPAASAHGQSCTTGQATTYTYDPSDTYVTGTTSSAPGTFSYSPAAGTVVGAGTQTLTATFIPTNPAQSPGATASVPLTVYPALPKVTWPAPADIAKGSALGATQLNASTPVAGTMIYSPASGTVLAVGPHTLTATFAPSDAKDYYATTATNYVTVAEGTGTYDSGTVTLAVNGSTVATASYGKGSTATSVAGALAAAASSSLVSVTAVDDALYIASKAGGVGSDYAWSLSAASGQPSVFAQPSFAYPTLSGSLGGGVVQGADSGTVVYSYTVPTGGYDGVGNLLKYSDNSAKGPIMGTWSFAYDNLNRVSGSTDTQPGNPSADYCWSYDSFGNRTTQSGSDQPFATGFSGTPATNPCAPAPNASLVNTNAAYGANNRMAGTTQVPGGVPYDASGDVLNDGSTQYLYDAEGRVCASANTPSPGFTTMTGYIYDADGLRVAKGTIAQWSCDPGVSGFATASDYVLGPGGEQVAEYGAGAGALAWQHSNVWAAGKLLATYDKDGLHFYLDDPLGSRRVQTDYAGATEQTCASLPFGDALACTGSNQFPTEHHFTGKERDAESGNDYFGARYYASSMGRFLSPDWYPGPAPIPYANIYDPQTLNLYSYVGNNPLYRVDYYGHNWFTDFLNGLADSTYRPIVHIVEHPIATAEGIGNAVAHPVVTARAIGTAVKDTVVAAAHGDGRAIGQIVGTVGMAFAGGAALRGVGVAGELGAEAGEFVGPTTSITTEQTVYWHYGYAADEAKFANGLRPGSFATTTGDLTGSEAKSTLALPHANAPDAVYQVTPGVGTPVNGPSTVEPAFGQPGGGQEVTFPQGTGPGTVGPATPIPPQ